MEMYTHQLFPFLGLVFLVSVVCTLFVGVQVMFEIRESEKRRGDKKYLM
jgi:hypothetical protein